MFKVSFYHLVHASINPTISVAQGMKMIKENQSKLSLTISAKQRYFCNHKESIAYKIVHVAIGHLRIPFPFVSRNF